MVAMWVWVAVGFTAWVVVALGTAVLIGRMLRLRDRQVPLAPTPAHPLQPGVSPPPRSVRSSADDRA